MSIGKWADASGHPDGAALVAAGFTGIICYVGTPGRAKNLTADRYRDYTAHGLKVAGVFENDATDVTSGRGAAYAGAAMADLVNIGAPRSTPLACAADRHLAAGEIATGVQYQRDFYDAVKRAGWTGPVGAYGFSEYTHAVHDAGVAEWLWQAGDPRLLWPGVHFWQRNDGSQIVGGVEVDINEQYLDLPGGFTVTPELETLIREIHQQMLGPWPSWVEGSTAAFTLVDFARAIDHNVFPLGAQVAALSAAVAALSKDPELTADAVRAIVADAVAAHMEITGTVEIHSTSAAPAPAAATSPSPAPADPAATSPSPVDPPAGGAA